MLARKEADVCDFVNRTYPKIVFKSFGQTIDVKQDYLEKFDSKFIIDDKYFTKTGDIVMTLRSPNNVVYINDDNQGLLISSFMVIIRLKDGDLVDGKFLAYYLKSNIVQKYLARQMQGTSIEIISSAGVRNIEVIIPTLSIQKKLVKAMRLLEQEQTLLDELQEYKKLLGDNILKQSIGL